MMNNMTKWQKERLQKQLKFYGVKKTTFISVYAKKPRILIANPKVNSDSLVIGGSPLDTGRQAAIAAQAVADAGRMALYQQQTQLGLQNSALRSNQVQQLSGLIGMSNGADMAQARNPFIPYAGGFL